MRIIEAEGKRLLRDAGIVVPRGVFIPFGSDQGPDEGMAGGGWYVKAQVPRGRRGRSGLVESCDRAEDCAKKIAEMTPRLGATPCAGWYCEERVPHEREWFVAMDADRRSGKMRLMASGRGGADVSEAACYFLDAPSDAEELPISRGLRDIACKLFHAVRAHDMVHAEINPLAETADGSLVALDAKIELDDAAAFRHPEWESLHRLPKLGRAPTAFESAYDAFRKQAGHRGTFGNMIELEGDVALILSGGGASLMALDALARAGGRAANYCEFSGNPEEEAVRRGAAIMFSRPGIRGVWIAGSHANFTDIHATVTGMLQAVEDAGLRVPVVIRRDGPRADQAERAALAWARTYGAPVRFHRADVPLESSAAELVRLMSCV
jgi:succinyl-CoA synthetase beta subunit